MRTVKFSLMATLMLGMIANALASRADDGDKPKHTIKEVMKIAHNPKTSLAKKVISGSASDDEKKELVALYVDLGKNTPKKGTPEAWKDKTDAVVQAAKDVEAGKPGAAAALQKAINCANCHKEHK
jgi:hypothetical protein